MRPTAARFVRWGAPEHLAFISHHTATTFGIRADKIPTPLCTTLKNSSRVTTTLGCTIRFLELGSLWVIK